MALCAGWNGVIDGLGAMGSDDYYRIRIEPVFERIHVAQRSFFTSWHPIPEGPGHQEQYALFDTAFVVLKLYWVRVNKNYPLAGYLKQQKE